MDNLKKGEELNQLSDLLFKKAAKKWYRAFFLEIFSGFYGIIVSFLNIHDTLQLLLVLIGFSLFAYAYFLRLQFNKIYAKAEMMLRQSVLSEGLNWPMSDIQFEDWKATAGKDILKKFSKVHRSPDYYATKQNIGPRKLLEMTVESAFWTKMMCSKLKKLVIGIFICTIILFVLLLQIFPLRLFSNNLDFQIIYALCLFLPVIMSLDIVGWILTLHRLITEIEEIEEDLLRLGKSKKLVTSQVMRLVAEYSCRVIHLFPIHPVLYKYWAKDVECQWDKSVSENKYF